MEKCTPHYKLEAIKAIVARDGVATFTQTALFGARALGLSGADACAVVASITRNMFYKSMTTHADHRAWPDVYHVPCSNKTAYIKVTLQEGRVVIQFKEQ